MDADVQIAIVDSLRGIEVELKKQNERLEKLEIAIREHGGLL